MSEPLYLLDTSVLLFLARGGPLGAYIDASFGLRAARGRISDPEELESVPPGTGDLASDCREGREVAAVVLEALLEDLHGVLLALVGALERAARRRQPCVSMRLLESDRLEVLVRVLDARREEAEVCTPSAPSNARTSS
jgi:hypothetical protein